MPRSALLLFLLTSLLPVCCSSDEVPSILAWTNVFGAEKLHSWFEDRLRGEKCAVHCNFMLRTNMTNETAYDALLFHSRDVTMTDLPEERRHSQQYFIFSMESPGSRAEWVLDQFPSHYFNATIGYSSRNDYVFDYDEIAASDLKMTAEMIKDKKESIMGAISNCRTASHREKVIDQLRQHINMTLRGSCYGGRSSVQENSDMMKSHRFILAFENRACEEYVTEKAFRYKHLIVPIVLSRRLVSDLLPSSAFIALDDFSSAAQFAARIDRLMENDEEYAKFFAWLNDEQRHNIARRGVCKLCQDLHARKASSVSAGGRSLEKAHFPDRHACTPRLATKIFKQ